MNNQNYIEAVRNANCALDLERRIVGVRFLFTEEEFNDAETEQPSARMTYCRMVYRASKGEEFKVNVDNFGCFAAARVLGVVDMDDWYVSGHYYGKSGLYEDYPTAKEVTDHMSMCHHNIVGIELRPLETFTIAPHIAIVVGNPFCIQRLIQGYAYKAGTISSFKFIGNQAMCSEATARPYNVNNINISMLCAGARKSGGKEHELALGIPLTKFMDMIEGLCKTITPVETNRRKKHIQEKFSREGKSEVDITLDTNYGDAMMAYDYGHFLESDYTR